MALAIRGGSVERITVTEEVALATVLLGANVYRDGVKAPS